ncbi:MAG: hypothetical protein JNN15_21275, partial [Blastocatellia bacterium]|nr:hypothetical protein [Blastocatellia bacterium]
YIRLELVSILRDWDNVIRNLKEKRHQDIIEALELEELEGVFKTELNKITSELKKLSTNYAITEEINTNLSWLNTLFRAELLLQSYFLEMSAFNPLRDLIGKLSILMRKVLRMNGYELMSIYLLDEQKPEADKLVYQTEDSDISKKLLSLINVQNRVKLHQNIRKIANFFVDVEGFRYLNINAGNNAENVKGICRVCLKTEAERR